MMYKVANITSCSCLRLCLVLYYGLQIHIILQSSHDIIKLQMIASKLFSFCIPTPLHLSSKFYFIKRLSINNWYQKYIFYQHFRY